MYSFKVKLKNSFYLLKNPYDNFCNLKKGIKKMDIFCNKFIY